MPELKIAIDVMGGDNAPGAILDGVFLAATKITDVKLVLVGDESKIAASRMKKINKIENLEFIHTPRYITMDENPVQALRQKRKNSISIGLGIVKETPETAAFVSAGNTGAVMVASKLKLGTLAPSLRPAIATIYPTIKGYTILLDVGANVDSKPEHLLEFAIMGSVYTRCILDIEKPKIGLLNIGAEEKKGNELVKQAYKLLKNSNLNFIGNIEGRDIVKGAADVIVCDGFVGNCVLKNSEAVAKAIFNFLKQGIKENIKYKIGAYLLKPVFKGLVKKIDYSEYGGAPLLGVKGISIICHGRSGAKAIMNAIRVARKMIKKQVNSKILNRLQQELSVGGMI